MNLVGDNLYSKKSHCIEDEKGSISLNHLVCSGSFCWAFQYGTIIVIEIINQWLII